MKITSKIFILLFSIYLSSCRPEKKTESVTGVVQIHVPNKIDNGLQFDSIFSSIEAVPLETKESCLMGRVAKVMFHKEKMIVLDDRKSLFVFNLRGSFINTIGKEGRGPGEHRGIRDFDIDDFGNIYILSYKEILKFTIDGNYVRKYSFDFDPSGIYCNPLEFAVISDNRFYVWGGSFGIKDNSEGKLYAMYEINDTGKILNSYFPLKYTTTQSFEKHRFSKYKESFLIEPNFGVNSIFALDSQGLKEAYEINFGSKDIKLPVPEGFVSMAEFKMVVDQNSYHSIESFIETDDWIYFRFLHKMKRYNVYYSKQLQKAYVSRFDMATLPQIITGRFENQFIGFCDPQSMIRYFNECTVKVSLRENIDFKNLKLTDNPILLMCSLKQY